MKEDKTIAEVKIHGNTYSFSGYESKEYIRRVCDFVDEKMSEILSSNKELQNKEKKALINNLPQVTKLKKLITILTFRFCNLPIYFKRLF